MLSYFARTCHGFASATLPLELIVDPVTQRAKITGVDRREFLAGAGAASAVAALILHCGPASAESTFDSQAAGTPPLAAQGHSQAFTEALAKITGQATPKEGVLSVELPELAENGNTVPYKLFVESPMTDTDYVKTMYLMSTANPQALVGTFHMTPAAGKAQVAGRMRLARTQDVVALAELSTGEFLIATRRVDVTIGGCGNE
jgi:sulfur-oxidizing protein SoxY